MQQEKTEREKKEKRDCTESLKRVEKESEGEIKMNCAGSPSSPPSARQNLDELHWDSQESTFRQAKGSKRGDKEKEGPPPPFKKTKSLTTGNYTEAGALPTSSNYPSPFILGHWITNSHKSLTRRVFVCPKSWNSDNQSHGVWADTAWAKGYGGDLVHFLEFLSFKHQEFDKGATSQLMVLCNRTAVHDFFIMASTTPGIGAFGSLQSPQQLVLRSILLSLSNWLWIS